MKIRVNGEIQLIEGPISLDRFLDGLKIRKEAIACELNRSIVQKARYSEIYLNENDTLEIVHFVGGG